MGGGVKEYPCISNPRTSTIICEKGVLTVNNAPIRTLTEPEVITVLDEKICSDAPPPELSCRPLLLADIDHLVGTKSSRTFQAGCLLNHFISWRNFDSDLGSLNSASMEQFVLKHMSSKLLVDAFQDWESEPVDSPTVIATALHAFKGKRTLNRTKRIPGQDEIMWWQDTTGRPPLRSLVKLRRLLLPVTVRIVVGHVSVIACPIQSSVADMWLKQPDTRNLAIERLLRCASMLKRWTSSNTRNSDVAYYHAELKQLLTRTLKRAKCVYIRRGTAIDLANFDFSMLESSVPAVNRRSYPENTRLELLDIHVKRAELVSEFASKIPSSPRLLEYEVIVTESVDGMTEYQFLEEAYFMKKVNATIPRHFDPLLSRPRLAKVNLSADTMLRLKAAIFDADGSLKASCANDITLSGKHHYINFTNEVKAGLKDKRWQAPFRLHSAKGKKVATRSLIESILAECKAIHLGHETTHDLGLLIGGTEDQSLHHDIDRQYTCWLPSKACKDSTQSLLGWETNRLAYVNAMSNRFAPRSIIVGMGAGPVYIGVQKDQIQRIDGSRRCRILHGSPYETFRIVRENAHLVVLEVEKACSFTGDFPHAGVRNFVPGSEEDLLMADLNAKIAAVLYEGMDQCSTAQAVVEILTRFKDLDKICRLHLSTELLYTRMVIPRNMVGYSDCYENQPGGECGPM